MQSFTELFSSTETTFAENISLSNLNKLKMKRKKNSIDLRKKLKFVTLI